MRFLILPGTCILDRMFLRLPNCSDVMPACSEAGVVKCSSDKIFVEGCGSVAVVVAGIFNPLG